MGITYIPRVFGGTIIIITGPVTVPVPTLLIAAIFRDGNITAPYRDGKQPAQYRDGQVVAGGR